LIRPDTHPDQTASGLWLAESDHPDVRGTIVAVGPDCHPWCPVGADVLFSWQVGQELWLNNGQDRFLLMREDDLLAQIEGDA